MQDYEADSDDIPVLNVIQVIALNVVATGAVFSALKTSGSSWIVSVLGGWAGGSVATVSFLAGAYWLSTLSAARANASDAESMMQITQKRDADGALPALVPADVTDPFQVWEADHLLELDHYINKRGKGSELETFRHIDRDGLEQMWHDDAAAEAEEAGVSSQRRAASDRRQASSDHPRSERRRAQRRS